WGSKVRTAAQLGSQPGVKGPNGQRVAGRREMKGAKEKPGFWLRNRVSESQEPRLPKQKPGFKSPEDAADHLALDQLARLVEVVIDDRVRLDPDAVVDRRQQFGRVDRVLDRGAGGLVRLAVDEAPLHAGAGDHRGVAVRPVVAAVVVVL